MNTLITYPSSYSFWMNQNPPMRRADLDFQKEHIKTVDADLDYYADIASKIHLPVPLHIMVSESRNRRNSNAVCSHVVPKNLRTASVVQISPSVWVVGPELTFLLAASELSFPKLVMAANNLCGTFYYENGIQKYRDPIVSVQGLNRFLESVSNVKGVRAAKAALQYASEGSNSPMETRMAAISLINISRGGYLLLPPKMNYHVKLSEEGQRLLHKESVCCDMVWTDQKVIVEYDSQQYHLSAEQFVCDKKRVSALNLSGFRVISVTNADLRSPELIDALFFSIRKALKMKNRKDRFAENYEIRRNTVKEIFYDSEIWQI